MAELKALGEVRQATFGPLLAHRVISMRCDDFSPLGQSGPS